MKDLCRAGGIANFESLVESLGGDASQILSLAGLKSSDLSDPDRYLSYHRIITAIEIATATLGRPDFGFRLADSQEIDFLGALAIAIQAADSPLTAIQTTGRFLRYHTPGASLSLEKEQEHLYRVSFSLLIADAVDYPQVAEHAVLHVLRVLQLTSRGELIPKAICLRHDRQSDLATYRRYLGQQPQFKAPFNGVIIDAWAARRHYRDANPVLNQFAQKYLMGAIVSVDDPLDERVQRLVNRLLRMRDVDLKLVATTLNMEPRTLQRRLRERGTSLQQITDRARRHLASKFLEQKALPLAQVSDMLGFADQSSFTRTCKRWFGRTPRQQRIHSNPVA